MTRFGLRPAARHVGPLLFALLLSGPIRAQAPGAAEVLFREGVTLAKDGRFADAIAKFQASYELDPARGTLLGWALAEERAGKVASGLAHYQQLRDEAKKAGDSEREAQATAAAARLVGRVPTVTIRAPEFPAGSEIRLGDRRLPPGALGTPLPLDPGEYLLVATAPDRARFERRLTLGEGDREQVTIELPALGPAPSPRPAPPTHAPPAEGWSTLRTSGLVVGAAGLVGLGVGSYFWFDSGSQYASVSDACPGRVCPPEQKSAIDQGRNDEAIGRVALILGGVVTTIGVALFIVGGNSNSTEKPSMSMTVTPGSMAVRGRF